MPSASYLRKNDYSTQEFKPFELPYASTLQEIATKTAYWQQGAAKIKQANDAALGLDPQFAQNKEYLKSFMDNANKELAKFGKSDLSIQDNVNVGLNIFKPLYDTSNPFNAKLLIDSETNSFYKKQSELADAARTADGGKTWNKNNQFYMQEGYQKYLADAKSGNINSIEDHYKNKKGYISYYDYSDELPKLLKNCHESSKEEAGVSSNPAYLQTISNKGVSEARMQGCLSFMSDQAKQQIGIDSFANYYGNKQGLVTDYQNLVYGRAKEQKEAFSAQLTAAKLKGDKEEIARLTDAFTQSNDRFEQGEKEWKSMLNGEEGASYVEKNYERIASVVGMQHFTEKAAKTFAWQDVKNKLSPNAVFLAQANINAQAGLQTQRLNAQFTLAAINHERAKELKLMEGGKTKKAGSEALDDGTETGDIDKSNVIIDPTNPNGANPEAMILKSISDGTQLVNDTKETLRTAIEQRNLQETGTYLRATDAYLTNFVNTYEKGKGVKDPQLSTLLTMYKKANQDLKNETNNYNAQLKIPSKILDNKTLYPTNITDATGNPVQLTEQDLGNIGLGREVKGFKVVKQYADGSWVPASLIGLGMTGAATALFSATSSEKLMYNGKQVDAATAFGKAASASISSNAKLDKFYEEQQANFANATSINKGYFTTGIVDDKTQKAINAKAMGALGFSDKVKENNVTVTKRDGEGNGYVVISKDNGTRFTKEELEDVIGASDTYKVKQFGVGKRAEYVIQMPSLFTPLPNYMEGNELKKLKDFTSLHIPDKPGMTNREESYSMTNRNGVDVDIYVTNMGTAQMPIPHYTLKYYDPTQGKSVDLKLPISLSTEQQALTAANTIVKE